MTTTTLTAVIPAYWTPLTLKQFFAKTVAANWFTDLSEYQSEGNNIYHIPDIFTNSFTVQTQSTQGTEVTLGNPATVDVTLTVATHIYIAYILDDLDIVQIGRNYNMWEEYTYKAGSALADKLEQDLFALWSSITTNVIGATSNILSDSTIRQSIEALEASNVPMNDVAFFLHPYCYWNQILAIQKYYDQSQFSRTQDGITYTGNFGPADVTHGLKGHLYGLPMFVSSNVVSGLQTYRNLLAHKNTIAFAIQTPGKGPRTRMQDVLENLGILGVHDLIYGTGILRQAVGAVMNASVAFIQS